MQISRLFEIVYILLGRERVTAAELAQRFEVSPRTIYRDIEALSAAGVPVYCAKGRGGGIALLPEFVLNKTALTEAQRRDILSALQGLCAVDRRSAQDTLARLSALFGAPAESSWVEIDYGDWGDVIRPQFEACKAAVLNRQVLAFGYHTAGGVFSRREAEPASLWFKGGTWYLKAWCRTRQAVRLFRLSRMRDVRPTGERFAPRPLPDTAALYAPQNLPAPTCIVAHAVPAMETRLYDDFLPRDITRLPDGSFLVRMQFILDEWVYGYLLSFGSGVEVLSPEEVRLGLRRRLAQALENYGGCP